MNIDFLRSHQHKNISLQIRYWLLDFYDFLQPAKQVIFMSATIKYCGLFDNCHLPLEKNWN